MARLGARNTTSDRSTKTKISDADLRKMIEKKAYELFIKRGYSEGNDWNDWLEAERLVKRQYNIR